MLIRFHALLFSAFLASCACVEASNEADYRTALIAPTKTSIYVGSVSLKTAPFARTSDGFSSTYHARVRPYFFASEKGRITIHVGEDHLRRLAAGETVDFTGEASNDSGEARTVTGRATPADARSGKIKVRVRVSPKVELIFNTSYVFNNEVEGTND